MQVIRGGNLVVPLPYYSPPCRSLPLLFFATACYHLIPRTHKNRLPKGPRSECRGKKKTTEVVYIAYDETSADNVIWVFGAYLPPEQLLQAVCYLAKDLAVEVIFLPLIIYDLLQEFLEEIKISGRATEGPIQQKEQEGLPMQQNFILL
ncbi:Hypothetical predicted protein [Podarcis lilfordi]|uniref:Uncharacterized protein n=1 Tax=Podarcis lilfordi TaxID=74358 RepID=A0AA35PA94_9SAUR|nr:Hypothetical predicted protein [Podarcis lilfordi]